MIAPGAVRFGGILILSALVGPIGPPPGAARDEMPVDPAVLVQQVRKGMPADEVRRVLAPLGPPRRVARQILFRRHLEQWIYDAPPVRIEFDCPRGEAGQVTRILTPRPVGP